MSEANGIDLAPNVARRTRAEVLERVSASLSSLVTPAEVARAIGEAGTAAMTARTVGVWLRDDDGALVLIDSVGYPEQMRTVFGRIPGDSVLPLADAVRKRAPVWLESRAQYYHQYPTEELGTPGLSQANDIAFVCMPLVVDDRALGAFSFRFDVGRVFDDEERHFVWMLARQCAQAIARARAFEAERRARRLVENLQRVTADLSGAATRSEIGKIFVGHVLEIFGAANAALVLLVADSMLEVIALAGRHPEAVQSGAVSRVPLSANYPLCVAIRNDEALWLSSYEESLAAFPEVVALDPENFHSVAAVPLSSRGTMSGGFVMRFSAPRTLDAAEREHLSMLATQCAEALERARLYEAERRSNEHLRILAEASAVLGSTLEYDETLSNIVRLVVPALADFAFFDVVERSGEVRRTALARDPEKQTILDGSRWSRSERTDVNLCALSSGKTGLHPHIDDAFLRDMATSDGHLEVLRRLELCAMLTVPLQLRSVVEGALTLCMGESKRGYDQSDAKTVEDLVRRAALAIDNARLFDDSRNAIRVRDEFLSIASHELNTPLAALNLQLYGIGRNAELLAPVRTRLVNAQRQVGRVTKLVAQLLDVSRITAGRLAIEREPFDLAGLVHEVVDRLEQERERAGSELRVDVEPVLGEWDRLRLDQVLSNLLANALKYGRGRPISLRLTSDGSTATLVIRDEGIGIEREKLERVFERFERAVSRNYGGFGLGLWISRQIIEALGGTVHVDSTLDVGSAFTVALPLAAPAEAR